MKTSLAGKMKMPPFVKRQYSAVQTLQLQLGGEVHAASSGSVLIPVGIKCAWLEIDGLFSLHLSAFESRCCLRVSQGAGVMSVYLFMKRYAEEELYRPHPALYRPRMSNCSDYSGQFLHPDSWPPPQRGRSASEASSDISIQLTQTPQPPPKGGGSCQETPTSSGPSSAASYQLQPASSSSTSSSYPHPFQLAATSTLPRAAHPHPHLSGPPSHSLPMVAPPSAKPPPHYHTHMRMSASPC